MPKKQKKNKKKPKSSYNPTARKEPKSIQNPEGFQHLPVAWHIQHMDVGGPWPCEINTINSFKDNLHEYEEMSWSEAMVPRSNHPMPVNRLCPVAKKRLLELHHEAATLYQLKISGGNGKQRLWGLRRENIFQILWWDPEHKVYPIRKRNT